MINCGKCKYWVRGKNDAMANGSDYGECKINPPHEHSYRPRLKADDGCGQGVEDRGMLGPVKEKPPLGERDYLAMIKPVDWRCVPTIHICPLCGYQLLEDGDIPNCQKVSENHD
jgi:hypothetical protein